MSNPITRETIFAALKTQLGAISFTVGTSTLTTTVSDVWKSPQEINESDLPYSSLSILTEQHEQEKGVPALKHYRYQLDAFFSRGYLRENPPHPSMHAYLDAVEKKLAPDLLDGFQTLGGTASHCWITAVTYYSGEGGTFYAVQILIEAQPLAASDNTDLLRPYFFDSGYLFATPRQGDPTPVKFGALRGVTLSVAIDTRYPGTQFQFKLVPASAVTTMKLKARVAVMDGNLLGQVFMGRDLTTGSSQAVINAPFTIPNDPGPYTVVPISAGSFVQDLGVQLVSTGAAFKKVTGTPVTGQYSLTGSAYLFAAADKLKAVAICYVKSAFTGHSMQLTNQFKGLSPSFTAVLFGGWNDAATTILLNNCISQQLLLPTSSERFALPDFEFEAAADTINNSLGSINLS